MDRRVLSGRGRRRETEGGGGSGVRQAEGTAGFLFLVAKWSV